MRSMPPGWWIIACFAAAAVLVLLLVMAVPLGTGIANLEDPEGPAELTDFLQDHAASVRCIELIDFLFIAFYSSVFWGLFRGMPEHWAPKAAIVLALVAALWDVAENTHLLLVLSRVEGGNPASGSQVAAVRALGALKFSFAAAGGHNVLKFGPLVCQEVRTYSLTM